MKQVTMYQTSNGNQFDTVEDAEKHEISIHNAKLRLALWKGMEKLHVLPPISYNAHATPTDRYEEHYLKAAREAEILKGAMAARPQEVIALLNTYIEGRK